MTQLARLAVAAAALALAAPPALACGDHVEQAVTASSSQAPAPVVAKAQQPKKAKVQKKKVEQKTITAAN